MEIDHTITHRFDWATYGPRCGTYSWNSTHRAEKVTCTACQEGGQG